MPDAELDADAALLRGNPAVRPFTWARLLTAVLDRDLELMEVAEPVGWAAFVSDARNGLRFLAHPGGLPFAAWPAPEPGGAAVLAVGPEGGFTEGEIAVAVAAGWVTVGLGATTLRMETAGLVGSARLLARGEG